MFKWNSKKEPTVKLEGCLNPSNETVLCAHGNHADSCYLCDREQKQKAEDNRNDFFSTFGQTIDLER